MKENESGRKQSKPRDLHLHHCLNLSCVKRFSLETYSNPKLPNEENNAWSIILHATFAVTWRKWWSARRSFVRCLVAPHTYWKVLCQYQLLLSSPCLVSSPLLGAPSWMMWIEGFFLSATAWTITWCLSKLNMWALSPYLLNRTAEMVVAWFWMTIWIHHPTKMPFRNPLVI